MNKVRIVNIVAIGLGGAIGSCLRYMINLYSSGHGYPIGTLLENLIGSFVLGGLTAWFLYRKVQEYVRLGLGVGLCGGFTTMSTLAADTVLLYNQLNIFHTLLYVLSSLIGGVVCAYIGYWLGDRLGRRKSMQGGDIQT